MVTNCEYHGICSKCNKKFKSEFFNPTEIDVWGFPKYKRTLCGACNHSLYNLIGAFEQRQIDFFADVLEKGIIILDKSMTIKIQE